MSTGRPAITVGDLVEEAKKRIVFLIICVVGLSYLMSLTSASVLVNLPAAACLIVILRYFSLDFDARRKAATYKSTPSPQKNSSQRRPSEGPNVVVERSDWGRKVNSPVVEDAIDQFTRHLVSEWVSDLWYSRITPDRQGPEELVLIINGVLAEFSSRMRNINLIDFMMRDVINLICTHLELFRACQMKIQKQESRILTIELRDKELKSVLSSEDKLHPALFSAEAEHKVLQHLMDAFISFTFKPEDLQCSLFRYIVRELIACAVMRPVLNLASPRFINERIEGLVISLTKSKQASAAQESSKSRSNGSSRTSSEHHTRNLDPPVKGVELVQLKKDEYETAGRPAARSMNGSFLPKDPLLSVDTQSTRSWSSLPSGTDDERGIQQHNAGGEWSDRLDMISRRKKETLNPENFENMWTKGRNYKKKEAANLLKNPSPRSSTAGDQVKTLPRNKEKDGATNCSSHGGSASSFGGNEQHAVDNWKNSARPLFTSCNEDGESNLTHSDEVRSASSSSYTSDDEEINNITGLDSPGTKVWDGKSNRNLSISHIHHPLESSQGHKTRKTSKGHIHSQRLPSSQSGSKKSKLSSQKVHVWQEVERTSFLSGDGKDILFSAKGNAKSEESSDDSEAETLGRMSSGEAASSSACLATLPECHSLVVNAPKSSLLADAFFKLISEVMGANIVRSGSKTFAVYSISVTDVNNNSWSIKRRFRHFEELHRRLKEFPEYNLHLPPKHFLSTGLDVPVIQERCQLLDRYLKKLLLLPTVSGSIEVWDFLSIDSQTYNFSNTLTIIETLSGDSSREMRREVGNHPIGLVNDRLSSGIRQADPGSTDPASQVKREFMPDLSKLNTKNVVLSPPRKPGKEFRRPLEDSGSESDNGVQKNISSNRNFDKTIEAGEAACLLASSNSIIDGGMDPTLPSEWVPPNLSAPILDLVDVIFQLRDGGWIRRKAFWVAKQVLQLGMGDALDDWLIEKIQLLRRGSVVASGIMRLEQILWPDGIFLTKHPNRQRPVGPSPSSPNGGPPSSLPSPKVEEIQKWEDMQQKEAERRAKFVYELMIDKAPAAIVSIVGRKDYEQCAKDLYYFLQSSVCLKQLAYELLELLLLSAFPEMDYVFRELQEEKDKFGEFKPT